MIGALFRFGQGEQLGGLAPGARDQVAWNAMIGDDREAEPLERRAELPRESVRVANLIGEAQGRDLSGGGVEHGWCPVVSLPYRQTGPMRHPPFRHCRNAA